MYSECTHIKTLQDTLLKVKSFSTLHSNNQYQQLGIISTIQKLTATNKACPSLSSTEPAQYNPKSINSFISIFSDAQGK
jgi:hypothetical protein